ncbi:MAG: type II secretion system F family protein, partial [Anaerolineales bacterium]|nr:type II secretion system F family protein [Anaerolineales bacterium]
IELAQPFSERVILPLARSMGNLSARFTPQYQVESTAISLELAGNPGRLDASNFLALRFVAAGLFGGLLFLFFLFSSNWSVSRELITSLIFTILGFFFPQLWLRSKIDRRQKEIRKALPDALDLLTICVEAGLGFDAAMAKVNEKWDNELALALGRAIREIQLGKLRREALRDMSDRIGIPEMTSFVAAVIQSEQLGVSMARVLRIQADQMRVKRRQRAEEEARKAPIKMILPMGIFIFPSIMIVLLTPAGLRLRGAFAPLMP